MYVPSLWYYEMPLFTQDVETSRESLNNEDLEDTKGIEESEVFLRESVENLHSEKSSI